MYATGITRSPECLINRFGLESHRHFILLAVPVQLEDTRTSSARGGGIDMHRYHLWVFDSPPLVLPVLDDSIVGGCADSPRGRVRGVSKGIDTKLLGDVFVANLISCLEPSTSIR
ncbi:hypothetical protein CPLU01_03357 [Colletotrichum plurivorum]|uniref:Uncharacterized protein n=1 Tax=Colletotrichum plurivorum TaxID=2175906 RepID=A0A8H6KTR4_9PEZI|nr:hypothetical protein CPLU01_03357 [Colletotrichum plurivorum]